MATSNQKRAAIALATAMSIASAHEGRKFTAYYDPPGILTVCEGHTGRDVVKGRVYSMAECDALLSADMKKAVAIVERCVPGLPPNVLAAFSDAVFNMGPTIACDPANSHAARYLSNHQLVAACNELPKWDKAHVAGLLVTLPGLTKRRAHDREVCLEDA